VIDDGFESRFTFKKINSLVFFFQELFGASDGFISDLVSVQSLRFDLFFRLRATSALVH
jgi:hypothetical protein